ncbi:hypothetical protein TKK_0019095 [Trichogramma kaykai]|uniref:Protein kinase domain-containing protein n=1 Tax=Trichogramma kaykai TaxID=54128 RepID=A0ABD2VUL9_9HYME
MGNEKSVPTGLEIDEKAMEITDFWSHHNASISGSNPQNLSVFISEPSLHSDASFGKPSPLEKAAKNLMLHRHPCILKYVASWSKSSKFYLASEEVRPLVQVVGAQTTLQICIGLHSLLRALLFLHNNAASSHNNICSSSVYVTSEGNWKLGGLEFLCKTSDITEAYMRKIKTFRYEKAISPDEDTLLQNISNFPSEIDKFAFAVLAEDVLKLKNDDDVPGLADFKDLCKLRFKDTSLASLLEHPFFMHDFMKIHAFLTELPLKNESEKEEFFTDLFAQLQKFPEKIVAEQLGKLLLSRLVVLDSTAQAKFLPLILKPKLTDQDVGLLTMSTFQTCLVPQLLQMFCIRDSPVRLLLLTHLNNFVSMFQVEDLKHRILPELLVGIKDTDDFLVSTTLRALADLVPILGAATVIGGKRGRLFTDGRPNKPHRSKKNHRVKFSTPIEIVQGEDDPPDEYLSERPSPDGGEDKEDIILGISEEENWSDWEVSESEANGTPEPELPLQSEQVPDEIILQEQLAKLEEPPKVSITPKYDRKIVIQDINELDIKNSKTISNDKKNDEEFDFFQDMEPVIEKTQIVHIEEKPKEKPDTPHNFTMNIDAVATDEGDGWDDENGWDDEEKE